MSIELREYQKKIVGDVYSCVAEGYKRLLAVAPVGSGKTTIAGALALSYQSAGKRVVFLAHRKELIDQAYNRFVAMGADKKSLAMVMSKSDIGTSEATIIVASIDTIRSRKSRPMADVIFVDESHRSVGRSYRAILDSYPSAIVIGLTATPFRLDGAGLGAVYEKIIDAVSVQDLIRDGYLVKPKFYSAGHAELKAGLDGVKKSCGDYNEKALDVVVNRRAIVDGIVENWLRFACGVRTIVFGVSVEHSKNIANAFIGAGVHAEHLDGCHSKNERELVLKKFTRGDFNVLTNCGLFGEGLDIPSVKCVVLARPTYSCGLYLQQVGRCMRPYDGQQAIVLDHGLLYLKHGLPDDLRDYTLDGCELLAKKTTVVCKFCFLVFDRKSRTVKNILALLDGQPIPNHLIDADGDDLCCPECLGLHKREEREVDRTIVSVQAPLVEIESYRRADKNDREMAWVAICEECIKYNYRNGWAVHKYKDRFGEWPPKHFKMLPRTHRVEDKVEQWTKCLRWCRGNKYAARIAYMKVMGGPPPTSYELASVCLGQPSSS